MFSGNASKARSSITPARGCAGWGAGAAGVVSGPDEVGLFGAVLVVAIGSVMPVLS
jgi:hypothetical protein